MAAVKHVDAELFGQRVCPVRAFAGDESIHAFGCSLLQLPARAAGHNPDAPATRRAAGKDARFGACRARQTPRQFIERYLGGGLKTDGLAVTGKEWAQFFETERGTKLRVVAKLGMCVERQM